MVPDNDPTEERLKEAFDDLKREDRRKMVSFDHLVEGARRKPAATGLRLMPWAAAAVLVLGISGYMVTRQQTDNRTAAVVNTAPTLPDDLGTETPKQSAPQMIAIVQAPPSDPVQSSLESFSWVPASDALLANPAMIQPASDRLLADASL